MLLKKKTIESSCHRNEQFVRFFLFLAFLGRIVKYLYICRWMMTDYQSLKEGLCKDQHLVRHQRYC